MTALRLIAIAVIAYVLGGVNGAILISRFVYHRDVRKYGSGNAGLTNFYRTFGLGSAAGVIAIDVAKSFAAILLGGLIMRGAGSAEIGRLFAGFCLILGHIFPAFYRFHGGKGALCGLILSFLVDWRVGVCVLLTFLIVVVLTRYVSLGSMLGALACPISMLVFGHTLFCCVLALLSAMLIIVQHAGNIVRLINGNERKLGEHEKSSKDEDAADAEK